MVRALPSPYDEGRFPGLVEALLNAVMKVLSKFTEFRKFENNNLCIIFFKKYTRIIKLL